MHRSSYNPLIIMDESFGKKEGAFEDFWVKIQKAQIENLEVEYDLPFPKHEFFEYLVQKYPVVLHGSYEQGLGELEPREANCRSKNFGNHTAVYACKNEVLPIFYAIRDVKGVGFTSYIISGYKERLGGDAQTKEYEFKLAPEDLERHPWADGAVYILPIERFVQGTNDVGDPIDEYACLTKVTPLAKIGVSPKDFPYFDKITTY